MFGKMSEAADHLTYSEEFVHAIESNLDRFSLPGIGETDIAIA